MIKKMAKVFVVFIVCMTAMFFKTEQAEAAPLDNAYEFYQTYGKQIAFIPIEGADGSIYYASRGKSSNSSIKYVLLGWQVSVFDNTGKVLDRIYYVRDGKNMVQIDNRTVNGYVYTLYKVTWSNLKSRMSEKARTALEKANCNIIFDGCMTVKTDGENQGGMNENGPEWGEVYTTYEDIANAENWTSASKSTLKSYYEKEVTGLFHTVTLVTTEGIASVSGGGRYCYGTEIKISAKAANGYAFSMWSGPVTSKEANLTYVMGLKDVTFTAYAKVFTIKVNFFRGDEEDGVPTETKLYNCNQTGQKLPDFSWKNEGYHQEGWSKIPDAEAADYTVTNGISLSWMEKNYPEINLYAVWKPNSYSIQFMPNGGSGRIDGVILTYNDQLELPSTGFWRVGQDLAGWGLTSFLFEYDLGEIVDVAELVKARGLEYRHDVLIRIFAIWGNGPKIYAEDVYVSLSDAQKGRVSIRWLSEFALAMDGEDGIIKYGVHENNSFVLTSYQMKDYMSLKKPGSVTETFRAIDSDGNVSNKTITVHIVDSTVYDDELYYGTSRFISKEYYKDSAGEYISEKNGGLAPNSVWRYRQEYMELLDAFFGGTEYDAGQ